MIDRTYRYIMPSNKEEERLGKCLGCKLSGIAEFYNEFGRTTSNSCEIFNDRIKEKLLHPEIEVPGYVMSDWGNCTLNSYIYASNDNREKHVSDCMPDHHEIEFDNSGNYDIETETKDRWEPCQPVYISAQTGKGKNTYLEETIFSYVKKLNRAYNTNKKVLVISNRKALRAQTEDRIKGGIYSKEFNPNLISSYPKFQDVADVMLYQGIPDNQKHLEAVQKQVLSNYLFVVCDEAHFFTSDSSFNPYTANILDIIVNTFKNAIRIYMTATPYDCIEYIEEAEKKKEYKPLTWDDTYGDSKKYKQHRKMMEELERSQKIITPKSGVCYHFKRNYDYLDTKYYSDKKELKEIIAGSGNEKWLIFIDNIAQCKEFRKELVEAGMKEDEVLAINAESKLEPVYQRMIIEEKYIGKIRVVIATSVIDNGVNFRGVHNVVLSDILKVKYLQMLGRARLGESVDRITLYLKRHDEKFLKKRFDNQDEQADAYLDYDVAYEQRQSTPGYRRGFLDKHYNNIQMDWEHAKHWFGRDKENPERVYPNTIARSLLKKTMPIYESILKEMKLKDRDRELPGQEYLEYQLSWFGKTYDRSNDVSLVETKELAREKIENGKVLLCEFLESHIGKPMLKEQQEKFSEDYAELYDSNFPKWNPNKTSYGISIINASLIHHNLSYSIINTHRDPKTKRTYWEVVRIGDGSDESYEERLAAATKELNELKKKQKS